MAPSNKTKECEHCGSTEFRKAVQEPEPAEGAAGDAKVAQEKRLTMLTKALTSAEEEELGVRFCI